MKSLFFRTFILDILFFGLLMVFLVVFFSYLQSSTAVLEAALPALTTIDPQEQAADAYALLQQIQPLATQTYILLTVVFPLALFLLYVIIVGFSWKGKHSLQYLWKFGAVSVIPFVLFVLSLKELFQPIWLPILFFISGFFAFVFYFIPSPAVLLIGIQKLYFLPLYLVYGILLILILTSLYLVYLSVLAGEFSWWIAGAFFFVLTLQSFYKSFLITKFQ